MAPRRLRSRRVGQQAPASCSGVGCGAGRVPARASQLLGATVRRAGRRPVGAVAGCELTVMPHSCPHRRGLHLRICVRVGHRLFGGSVSVPARVEADESAEEHGSGPGGEHGLERMGEGDHEHVGLMPACCSNRRIVTRWDSLAAGRVRCSCGPGCPVRGIRTSCRCVLVTAVPDAWAGGRCQWSLEWWCPGPLESVPGTATTV